MMADSRTASASDRMALRPWQNFLRNALLINTGTGYCQEQRSLQACRHDWTWSRGSWI